MIPRSALVAILGALVVIACQSAPSPTSGPTASGDHPAVPSASADPGANGPDFPPEMIVGEGDFVLGDPTLGLSDLTTYTATLTTTFSGGGQTWTATTTKVVAADLGAATLAFEQAGDIAPLGADDDPPVSWAAVEADLGLLLDDAGVCSGQTRGPDAAPLDEPAAALWSIFGGTAAGVETVGGLETRAYTFDAAALGLEPTVIASGTVWIAPSSELVVRFESTVEAGAEFFGEGVEGTLTTRYELTGINEPTTLAIPLLCPTGRVVAPRPPGATVLSDDPGVLTMSTTGDVRDVATFYRGAATGAGWTAIDDQLSTVKTAIMKYQAPGLDISVIATKTSDGTSIAILTSRR